MPYKGYYIVSKQFKAGTESLVIGTPIHSGDVKNTRSLLEAKYIREPIGEEDTNKIEELLEDKKNNIEEYKEIIQEYAKEMKPGEISKKIKEEFDVSFSYQAITKLLEGKE